VTSGIRGTILIVGATALAFAYAAATNDSAAPSAADNPPPAPAKPLDLRAPDITKLYTREQLDRLLAQLNDTIEEVEVEGAPVPPPTFTPQVWGGIAAPLWALLHPLQAWRIIAPVAPDQARNIGNEKPDATSGFLEPAGAPP
jgi:hypothetical protein